MTKQEKIDLIDDIAIDIQQKNYYQAIRRLQVLKITIIDNE